MPKGLVYVSEAVGKFDEPAIRELSSLATTRNREIGVTGFLYFEGGRFVQYIEGPTDALEMLFSRIEDDERHVILKSIGQEVSERRFPQWRMRWVRAASFARLEEVLASHLTFMRNIGIESVRWSELAWGMVDRIAELAPILDEIVE